MSKPKPIKTERFYICDPKKNKECTGNGKKGWCEKICFCTTKIKYAKDGFTKPLTDKEYDAELERNVYGGSKDAK